MWKLEQSANKEKILNFRVQYVHVFYTETVSSQIPCTCMWKLMSNGRRELIY